MECGRKLEFVRRFTPPVWSSVAGLAGWLSARSRLKLAHMQILCIFTTLHTQYTLPLASMSKNSSKAIAMTYEYDEAPIWMMRIRQDHIIIVSTV